LPTFVEKARRFPGTVFVVGADTAERILSPRYYAGGESGLHEGLATIRAQGCRFLVAGRMNRHGVFQGNEHLAIADAFQGLFTGIPRELFQRDISSTQIREGKDI
jgi:hypothetical protein